MKNLNASFAAFALLMYAAARAEPPATQPQEEVSLRALCLRVYTETMAVETGRFSSYPVTEKEFQQDAHCYGKFADAMIQLLKKYPDKNLPGAAEARKLLKDADGIAHEYLAMVDLHILNGERNQQIWAQMRPHMTRADQNETELNNIIMKWTFEQFGHAELFVPEVAFVDREN